MGKKVRNSIAGLGILAFIWLWGAEWMGQTGSFSAKEAGGQDRQWGIYSSRTEEELPLPQAQGEERDKKVKGYVALTFDDGPHPVYTPRLLEGLRERGVCATFFLIGQNIDGNEDIIKKMKENGHLIGNHSQNHMQLTRERAGEACEQISRTNEKIRQITGEVPEYVRPPYGSWSEELECLVPMKVVLWNLDTLDT